MESLSEKRLRVCRVCGKEVDFGRIFCDKCNTPINRQIFEFFSELPPNKDGSLIRPRGQKIFDTIKYYLAAKLGLSDDKRIILKSATGSGKCSRRGTLVSTKKGFIPIEKIQIGDIVNSFDLVSVENKEHLVLNKFKFEDEETICLETDCGYEFEGTPDHKIAVINQDGDIVYQKLKDFSKSDYVLINYIRNYTNYIPEINFSFQPSKRDTNAQPLEIKSLTPLLANFLGYYVAEGYINDDHNFVSITNAKEEIKDEIENILRSEFPSLNFTTTYHPDKNTYTIRITSIALVKFLKFLGIEDNSDNKRIPIQIFSSLISIRVAFLKAYLNGNRYFEQTQSTSKNLIKDLQKLLLSIGILSYYRHKTVKYNNQIVGIWRLSSLLDPTETFEEIILDSYSESNLFLDKVKIIKSSSADVFDITVEETHNYIANGFVSHNSVLLDMLAFIELTHFPNSLTVIGSISEPVSKIHVERLREWIGNSVFNKYMIGSHESTASKTEIKLAKLNSKVISMPQCFTEDAEILTDDGWKYFSDLNETDKVGEITVDNELIFSKPTKIIRKYYNGEIIHFKNKSLDFSVTPNHKLYVASSPGSKFKLKEAKDIKSQHWLTSDIKWKGKEEKWFTLKELDEKWFDHPYHIEQKKIPIEDWLLFFGLYIADGFCDRYSYKVVISQSQKSPYLDEIRSICYKLPFDIAEEDSKDGMHSFTLENKQLWKELKVLGKSSTKYVPKYIKNLTPNLIKKFLQGYLIGDGWHDTFTHLPTLSSTSKKITDDIQECFLKAGFRNSRVSLSRKESKVNWDNYVHKKMWRCEQRKKNFTLDKKFAYREAYSGMVYCVEVPSEKILVRSRGVPFVSGNSPRSRTGWHSCSKGNTEVLTPSGWKQVSNIKENDLVLSYNKITDSLLWEHVSGIQKYNYDGDLIHWKSRRRKADITVTPQHRMLYRMKATDKLRVGIADDLKSKENLQIPVVAKAISNNKFKDYIQIENKRFEIKLFLQFLGYFLSEGWIHNRQVQISQSKKSQYFEKFKTCLEKIWKDNINYDTQRRTFSKGDVILVRWLKKECGANSHEKKVPRFVFELNPELINIFLQSYCEGDAHFRKKGWVAHTVSKQLADDIQALLVLCGEKTSLHPNIRNQWIVSKLYGSKVIHFADAPTTEHYKGEIFGLSVPSSYLVYRENNQVFISGNSLLVIDEIGRIEPQSYYASFSQMAAQGGIEISASTPYLESIIMQNLWYSDDTVSIGLEPEECFWIPKSVFTQKEKEYKESGYSELYEQLYNAKFRSVSNRVIPDDILLQAISNQDHLPSSGNLVMGVDFGRSIDYTAVVVIDIETGDVKHVEAFQDDWQIQFQKIKKLYKDWNPLQIKADSSGMGSVIISDLADLPIDGVSMHNEILKKRIIDKLLMGFFNGRIHIVADKFPRLVNELSHLVYLDQSHNRVGPVRGGKDDTCDALGLALSGMDISTESLSSPPKDLWSISRVDSESSNSLWQLSYL